MLYFSDPNPIVLIYKGESYCEQEEIHHTTESINNERPSELNETIISKSKMSINDFKLLKVLGKGSYGKVDV